MSKTPYSIVVCGGKGGTGKSTVACSLSLTLAERGHKVLLVDMDVDSPAAANLLEASPKLIDEITTFKPAILKDKCTGCGRCVEVCREHALLQKRGEPPILIEELCSGCTACLIACPASAIGRGHKVIGALYFAKVAETLDLLVGELKPGEARSPIVALYTRLRALKMISSSNYQVVIVDAAPGAGNTVAQALLLAERALAVTEPTPLGLHDLILIMDLAEILEKSVYVVVNKASMPSSNLKQIREVCNERGVPIVAEIPYDLQVLKLQSARKALAKSAPLAEAIDNLASFIERKARLN